VGAADAEVVEAAVVPKGDHAGVVDSVVADPVVPGGDRLSGWCRLGSRVEGGLRGGAAQGAVWAGGVVVAAELVELGLQLANRGDRRLPG
jgi:hypothetical protein